MLSPEPTFALLRQIQTFVTGRGSGFFEGLIGPDQPLEALVPSEGVPPVVVATSFRYKKRAEDGSIVLGRWTPEGDARGYSRRREMIPHARQVAVWAEYTAEALRRLLSPAPSCCGVEHTLPGGL
jgi:hypothetical protein